MAGGDTTFHVGQGEMAVSSRGNDMLTAVLGSCVSACIWDPQAGIGGMNHILLPEGPEGDLSRKLYGTHAMEVLINQLLHGGAARMRLQAKLFGGARMIAGLSDIGERNSRFVSEFCRREEIPVIATSLGGTEARRVQFWPGTGKARQRIMVGVRVTEPPTCPRVASAQEVELF